MLLNIDREEDLRMAVDALRAGKLVAFPTETVYGLGADGFNEEACRAVYTAKGRPSDNPLILHIADMSALRDIAEDIPEAAVDLAEAFWPGPLTLVLKKRRNVSSVVSGGWIRWLCACRITICTQADPGAGTSAGGTEREPERASVANAGCTCGA